MLVDVISTSRSDYGHLLSILTALKIDPAFALRLVQPVGVNYQEYLVRYQSACNDGFTPVLTTITSKQADFALILGDRYELLEAIYPYIITNTVLGHIHAGEETEGAVDNNVRHSLSKLSHLFFVAHQEYGARLMQMGEPGWRIHVVGAPALDLITPCPCTGEHVLVVFHPVTLEAPMLGYYMTELQAALEDVTLPIVIVGPNSDVGYRYIDELWRRWVSNRKNATYYSVVPPETFWDLMATSAVLVGNSSAAFIEAPSFSLPCVNIGSRQTGRFTPANVINVGYDRWAIRTGINVSLSETVRDALRGMANPLWKGGAAKQIVEVLRNIEIGDKLLRKKFVSLT